MAVIPATIQTLHFENFNHNPFQSIEELSSTQLNPFMFPYDNSPYSYLTRNNVINCSRPFHLHSLYRLLALESQFYVDTSCLLFVDSDSEDKVDAYMRDEALTRLLSLHRAYYDLSPITFTKAVCLLDTFITKVKVKPKYLMCVVSACYYISSKFENNKHSFLTLDSLVRLSNCGGTSSDLVRMVDIIITKLGSPAIAAIGAESATALNFLQLFINQELKNTSENLGLPNYLVRHFESILCTTKLSCFRPSCIALALLSAYKQNPPALDFDVSINEDSYLILKLGMGDLFNLSNLCKISWADVDICERMLSDSGIINSYSVSPVKSSMVWNVSRRIKLNLSNSSTPHLNTITE